MFNKASVATSVSTTIAGTTVSGSAKHFFFSSGVRLAPALTGMSQVTAGIATT